MYASLGDRMLAVILDTFLLMAAFWAVGMWLAPRLGGVTPSGFNLQGLPALAVIGLSLLTFFIYYVLFEWWFGTTLGKIVAGVKITTVEGGRLSFRASLVRNLMRLIDGLGIYLVAAIALLLSKKRRRLGDMAAGTVVVTREYWALARVAALLALLILLVGTIVLSFGLRVGSAISGLSGASTAGTVAESARQETTATAATPAGEVRPGTLALTHLRLAAGKDGPERPDGVFKPGETAALLFDLEGFATDAGGIGRVKMRVNALDPLGVHVIRSGETELHPSSSGPPRIESWATVPVPEYALPGEHRIEVTVIDLVVNRQVAASAPFKVDASPYQAAESLTVQNFRATQGERGAPRPDSVYSPGSDVWLAFDLSGFKGGADGEVRLQEDMVLTAASGESGKETRLLDVNQQFFYLPLRVPVTNHISLGTMPAGEYQARLTFTDLVGNQKYEQVYAFTIR